MSDTEPLHEWCCPACGATTRARMADHDPTEPEPLAMQARTLLVRCRELEATVARVREVVADLESFVVARGYPATGTYDDGLTRAQAATAADLRRALDGEPQP